MYDIAKGTDGAIASVSLDGERDGVLDVIRYKTIWTCEKWGQEQCDEVALLHRDVDRYDVPSQMLRKEVEVVGAPEEILVVHGNLLLQEGLQRMLDLLIGAAGAAYNNAGSFIGVGDTLTAEAATQTELLALAAAANRFYKGMVATYPIRTNQTVDWRSDFTSTEANFVWNEWTVAAGATGISGAGFLTGTTNLNRKVQALGTKTTGTWTLTASITFS